jgi:hypothetical protein
MDVLDYYKLKENYQDKINDRKEKIKKKEGLTLKEIKARFKKLIPKCVNCDKAGGTIFEEKNGMLKAVCAATPQCSLNINIKRKLYDNAIELEQKNDIISENLKLRIIMTKLEYLFGLNNSKEDTIDKFNKLKGELAQISETQLVLNKKFGHIISGDNRDPLLNDANIDLANEIDELKKIYAEYSLEASSSAGAGENYITAMVEKYISLIKPLVDKIRKMQYGYYAIEPVDDENDVYRLVANPYRFDQLEQERK